MTYTRACYNDIVIKSFKFVTTTLLSKDVYNARRSLSKIESLKIDEFSLTTIMINEIVMMRNMTQFELTFIVKNLSQNLSWSCLWA